MWTATLDDEKSSKQLKFLPEFDLPYLLLALSSCPSSWKRFLDSFFSSCPTLRALMSTSNVQKQTLHIISGRALQTVEYHFWPLLRQGLMIPDFSTEFFL